MSSIGRPDPAMRDSSNSDSLQKYDAENHQNDAFDGAFDEDELLSSPLFIVSVDSSKGLNGSFNDSKQFSFNASEGDGEGEFGIFECGSDSLPLDSPKHIPKQQLANGLSMLQGVKSLERSPTKNSFNDHLSSNKLHSPEKIGMASSFPLESGVRSSPSTYTDEPVRPLSRSALSLDAVYEERMQNVPLNPAYENVFREEPLNAMFEHLEHPLDSLYEGGFPGRNLSSDRRPLAISAGNTFPQEPVSSLPIRMSNVDISGDINGFNTANATLSHISPTRSMSTNSYLQRGQQTVPLATNLNHEHMSQQGHGNPRFHHDNVCHQELPQEQMRNNQEQKNHVGQINFMQQGFMQQQNQMPQNHMQQQIRMQQQNHFQQRSSMNLPQNHMNHQQNFFPQTNLSQQQMQMHFMQRCGQNDNVNHHQTQMQGQSMQSMNMHNMQQFNPQNGNQTFQNGDQNDLNNSSNSDFNQCSFSDLQNGGFQQPRNSNFAGLNTNVSIASEMASPKSHLNGYDPNESPVSVGPPRMNNVMDKLSETMRRSAMSRSMVKQFSGKDLVRHSSMRGLMVKQGSARGVMNGQNPGMMMARHSSRNLMRQGSDRSLVGDVNVRSAPVRRMSNGSAKHHIQHQGRGVQRHDSQQSLNGRSNNSISIQLDGRNIGTM